MSLKKWAELAGLGSSYGIFQLQRPLYPKIPCETPAKILSRVSSLMWFLNPFLPQGFQLRNTKISLFLETQSLCWQLGRKNTYLRGSRSPRHVHIAFMAVNKLSLSHVCLTGLHCFLSFSLLKLYIVLGWQCFLAVHILGAICVLLGFTLRSYTSIGHRKKTWMPRASVPFDLSPSIFHSIFHLFPFTYLWAVIRWHRSA